MWARSLPFTRVSRLSVNERRLDREAAERRNRLADTARQLQHHPDEAGPAPQMRGPEAEAAAVPGGNPRLVQRREPGDAVREPLREPDGVLCYALGIVR